MKIYSSQKRLDIFVSTFLALIVLLSSLYRLSPLPFINPDFPIFEEEDLVLPNQFVIRTFSGTYNIDTIAYEAHFLIDDFSQILPVRENRIEATGFSGFHDLLFFSGASEAVDALNYSYEEYIKEEGDFPIRISNIPLSGFSSKADHHLLWCEQASRVPTLNSESVETCYYWAVYSSYLSKTRVSMWPTRGGGRRYSFELFGEVIKTSENVVLSKVNQ